MAGKLAKEIREPIIKFIDQGLTDEEIARRLRIKAVTVKGVRQRLKYPVWIKADRPDATPTLPETPEDEVLVEPTMDKPKALLTIAEIIMRSAANLNIDIDSLYVDKSGKAIASGTNGGRSITLETNVLAK